MTLTFPLTGEDWRAFRDHHARSDLKIRRIRIAGWIGLGFLLLTLAGVVVAGGAGLLLRAAIVAGLAVVWFFACQKWGSALSARIIGVLDQERSGRYEGVHVVKIQMSGIEHKYQITEKSLSWADIQRVESTRDHLFLYETPVSAIIIPGRKLSSESDFAECVELAKTSFARVRESSGQDAKA